MLPFHELIPQALKIAQIREDIIELREAIARVLNHLKSAYTATSSTGATAYTMAACVIVHRGFVDKVSVAAFMQVFSDQERVIRTLRNKTYSLSRAVQSLDTVVPRWIQPRTRLRPIRSSNDDDSAVTERQTKLQKFQTIEETWRVQAQ
jgi:hypothetical protein